MQDRSLNLDEKIKKAEEIYNRRMGTNNKIQSAKVPVSNKTSNHLIKKMVIQIFICFFIYMGYYIFENSNYIFSTDFLNRTKEVLSYNVDIESVYNKAKKYFEKEEKELSNDVVENFEEKTEQNIIAENVVSDSQIEQTSESVNSVEETLAVTDVIEEDVSSISQMEQDAREIKNKVEMMWPLQGTVTSRFGTREASTIVSAYHQGIDIAKNIGTKILCGMEGDVTLVSEEGGYGKQIRITNGDILTIYAHCNSIYVKEGEHIKIGQEIGEVGSTGNSTGPHLHFEVRYQDRLVNPENILGEI